MPPKKTRGIVLREHNLNDSDKIITIFSENGKFKAVANNVRHPKSKLAAGTRHFAWSEFTYYPGKNLARLTEANIIDSFYNIGQNLEAVYYVSYCLELIDKFYDEEQIDKVLLKLIVYYLYYLNNNPSNVLLLTLAFQIKFLHLVGISPDFKSLRNCDKGIPVYFSIKNGSFSNTFYKGSSFQYRLNIDQINWLLLINKEPFNYFKNYDLTAKSNTKDIEELISILNHFIEYHLGQIIISFKVLNEIKSDELKLT